MSGKVCKRGHAYAAFMDACPYCVTVTAPGVVSQSDSVVSQSGSSVVSRQEAWKRRQGERWREHRRQYMRAYRERQ